MKVKELIRKLFELDPDARVALVAYEGGYNEVDGISEARLKPNANPEWYSDHYYQNSAGEISYIITAA